MENDSVISLARLRQLDQEATPGPWEVNLSPKQFEEARVWGPGSEVGFCDGRRDSHYHVNAALIVAMREAIPALLELAEAARHLPRCSCGMPEDTRRFDEALAAFSFDEEQA